MATIGEKYARSDMDTFTGTRDELPTQEAAQAGEQLASRKARVRKVLRESIVCKETQGSLHSEDLIGKVSAAVLRYSGGEGPRLGSKEASSSCRKWSARRSAKATIIKVEFAWPEVTNVELLAI